MAALNSFNFFFLNKQKKNMCKTKANRKKNFKMKNFPLFEIQIWQLWNKII